MHRQHFYTRLKGFVLAKSAAIGSNEGIDQLRIAFGNRIVTRNKFSRKLRGKEQVGQSDQKIGYRKAHHTKAKIATRFCCSSHDQINNALLHGLVLRRLKLNIEKLNIHACR